MKEYSFGENIVEFFKRVYEKISTDYRMARFEEMQESGELENMCSSEVHKRFMIWREG